MTTYDLLDYQGGHSLDEEEAIAWSTDDYWTHFEACLLLSGIEPSRWGSAGRDFEEMENYIAHEEIDPIDAEKRLKKVIRAGQRNRQFELSRKPIHFLICAQRMKIPIPKQLHDNVLERVEAIPSWGPDPQFTANSEQFALAVENPVWFTPGEQHSLTAFSIVNGETNDAGALTSKELNSYRKLIAGLAIGEYGYNPNKLRNPTGRILAAIQRSGLTLDQATVKKIIEGCIFELDHDFTYFDHAS